MVTMVTWLPYILDRLTIRSNGRLSNICQSIIMSVPATKEDIKSYLLRSINNKMIHKISIQSYIPPNSASVWSMITIFSWWLHIMIPSATWSSTSGWRMTYNNHILHMSHNYIIIIYLFTTLIKDTYRDTYKTHM